MPELLNDPRIIAFIAEHENDDVSELLLKSKSIFGVPASVIADQITGRRKAKGKLPLFYSDRSTIYPPAIHIEQCSSDQTARFKSDLVMEATGTDPISSGLDLTGGMGVDSLFLSRQFQQFHYVEPDNHLLEVARHNLERHARNIIFHNSTAEAFIRTTNENFDLVYIDPSRRTSGNRKVVGLDECVPDVITLQHDIFRVSNRLLIKTSPLLDIRKGLRDLKSVKRVIVVSVANECREVLFFCERGFHGDPDIMAVDINNTRTENFRFTLKDENEAVSEFGEPSVFLYEPNASIRKAGAFKLIGTRFGVNKLHINTHLYSSRELKENFPGRIFRIIAPIKARKEEIATFFPDKKANVITRNYPLSPEELKKKTGLKDGGERYLFGFTSLKGKSLVVAERLA